MIAWAIEAVVASTALMLLVMVLRRPVAEHFGAQAAYALWALPALRMVLPPLTLGLGVSAPMLAVEPVSGSISDVVRSSIVAGGTTSHAAAVIPVSNSLGSAGWIALAVLIWLVGAGLFLIGHVWGYRRFRAHLLSGATVMGEAAPGVALLASPRASGPMAFGLRQRLIVFPADASDRFDSDEHALALAHELAHHRRGDLLANAFALLVVALHWWNPVAWAAYRLFRADQEVACDAQVVAEARRRGLGQAYGRTLIKAATNREFAIACHLTSVETLKRRLAMLAKATPSSGRRRLGLLLIGGTTLGGLALTASGQGVAADMGSKVAHALPAQSVGHVLSRTLAPVARLAPVASVRSVALPTSVAAPAEVPVLPAAPEQDAGQTDVAWAPPTPPAPPVAPVPPTPPTPPRFDVAQARAAAAQAREQARQHQAEWAAAQAERAKALAEAEAERARLRIDMARTSADRSAALAQARASQAHALAAVHAANIPTVVVTQDCKDVSRSGVSEVHSVEHGGRTTVSIRACGDAIARNARAQAIAGIREARQDIMNDQSMSHEVRMKVLTDLDRQIARLRSRQD
ncbi:M56 family metallopeptidase [Sphingobium sp. CR28]|uniref:M56 family metallopeptidase n=1 Tax=Sphingobium sp. CR28 TaxID=3400272 RepID=UPI003FEE691D